MHVSQHLCAESAKPFGVYVVESNGAADLSLRGNLGGAEAPTVDHGGVQRVVHADRHERVLGWRIGAACDAIGGRGQHAHPNIVCLKITK